MSTEFFSNSGDKVMAAWESEGQVYFTGIDTTAGTTSVTTAAPGPAEDRKHPAVVRNRRGTTLLAWTEGTAWKRGGALAWQVFDSAGQPTGERGRVPGVPVWGVVTAYVRADDGFTIVY
jgi:hypothetical protein